MADTHLEIPSDMRNFGMHRSTGDRVFIKVKSDCNWCYSDSGNCFGGDFLPSGQYTASETEYGPYTPQGNGTVNYNAVTTGDCNPFGVAATGHTIIISN